MSDSVAKEGTKRQAKGGRRRGHNEGTIYQRADGRWSAQVTLPGSAGKRKTVSGKTRAEVSKKLRELLGAIDMGQPIGDKTTVGAFLTRWLEDSVKPSVRPSTYQRSAQIVNGHLIPAFGRISLAKLTAPDVQRVYSVKLAGGLSPATVIRIHAVLHRALAQAVRWGMTPRNVADLVDRPQLPRHEIRPLDKDQSRALLEEAKGSRFEALFVLALTTGLRQGEVLGLRWQDVDLEASRQHVRQTWDGRRKQEGPVPEFGPPKTHRSTRGVTLTRLAVSALKAHRLRQTEDRLRATTWHDYDLAFPGENGRPMDPHNLTRRHYKPLLRDAGLPDVRFHDLRHSTATLLLSQKIHGKVVQELLGHSRIGVTLDVYSHVVEGMHGEAADAMDRLLGTG